MNPVDRIQLCLSLGGIDRPAEVSYVTARGKITKPDEIKTDERLTIYKAAAETTFALLDKALRSRDRTIKSGKVACLRVIELGGHLLKCQKAFGNGDFTEWLENYCVREGFCRMTAYRYMRAYRHKESLGPDVEFETIKDLFISAGIMPAPQPGAGGRAPAPFFRLAFQLAEDVGEPEKWDSVVRDEFLEKARPVVELYAKAMAAKSLN